mgnify:CR=1 FL=1
MRSQHYETSPVEPVEQERTRGDDEDFRKGLLELIPFLRAFSRSLCGDRELADDLAQEALANETVEVSVGGGALTIVITGHQRVQSIKLNAALLDTSDADWATDLEDLLITGVNQAIEQSQTMAAASSSLKVTP